mgnify:CR=1 FL=1
MKGTDVVRGLNLEYDDTKSDLVNLYNFAIIFLDKTDKDDKLKTRIMQHTLRTMKLADKILKKELADRQIVITSLLLHDLGKTLTESRHDLVSYDISKIFLEYTKIEESRQKRILDCILYHSAKNIKSLDLSIEQKVVMDADILDEIGMLTIVKQCLKFHRNKDINEIIKQLEDNLHKIEKEQSHVQTKYGRELYAQKKNKLKELIELLRLEAGMFKIK